MLTRIIQAIIVGVVIGLLCYVIGLLLGSLNIPPLAVLGGFLVQFAWALGVLAAFVWYFFGGSFPSARGPA